jgi:hypothetical protein
MSRGTRTIADALRFALAQRGQPYLWGGTSRSQGGFDCSGLIWAAYRQAGFTGIARTTYDMIHQGVAVPMNQLQPGDLIFPSTHHVGIYLGNGRVLSSPHTGAVVHISQLSGFGYLTARRLINGGNGVVAPRGIAGVHFGLPVPSSNPIDRLPHPSTHATAALLALLSDHQPIKGAPITLPKPGETLAKLMPQFGSASLTGSAPAGLAANALPTQRQLPQLQVPQSPTASGLSTGQVATNLDSIRRQLLKVQ